MALSFAGAQREYVEQVAAALKARGVRCFYDADEQVELWGRHLAEELPADLRRSGGRWWWCSSRRSTRPGTGPGWSGGRRWPGRCASGGCTCCPARFDDSELPGLLDDVVAVDLRRHTPEQFADLVAAKLASLAAAHRAARGSRPGPRRPGGCWRR